MTKQKPIILSALLVACSPGMSDFSEDIGDTDYQFNRTSSSSMSISAKQDAKCKNNCAHIPSKVIHYLYNNHVIAIKRQVINLYKCKESHVTFEITSNIVFNYILLSENKVFGPYKEIEFEDIMNKNNEIFSGVAYSELVDNGVIMSSPRKLQNCTSPKLL